MRFFGVITAAAIKKAHAEGANKKNKRARRMGAAKTSCEGEPIRARQ